MKTLAMVHKGLTAFISLGVFAQMFLAGVWHAGVVNTPDAHVFFGLALLLASLLALIAAAVAKLPKAVIGRTALLFFLILLQPFLMEARRNGLPFVSAFHALNAPFIGIVAGMVAAMSRESGNNEATAVSVAAGD
ncbi:MAG: hypothetical protein DHS20C20_15310 [Ardenticatenaceae bacterium]|nr:MAG: hypothetical protein DHS20C20_15310 [Ardenticatenaceae bacterium]